MEHINMVNATTYPTVTEIFGPATELPYEIWKGKCIARDLLNVVIPKMIEILKTGVMQYGTSLNWNILFYEEFGITIGGFQEEREVLGDVFTAPKFEDKLIQATFTQFIEEELTKFLGLKVKSDPSAAGTWFTLSDFYSKHHTTK